jgi:hypothetical protein
MSVVDNTREPALPSAPVLVTFIAPIRAFSVPRTKSGARTCRSRAVVLRRDALGIAHTDLSQNTVAGRTERLAQNAGLSPDPLSGTERCRSRPVSPKGRRRPIGSEKMSPTWASARSGRSSRPGSRAARRSGN